VFAHARRPFFNFSRVFQTFHAFRVNGPRNQLFDRFGVVFELLVKLLNIWTIISTFGWFRVAPAPMGALGEEIKLTLSGRGGARPIGITNTKWETVHQNQQTYQRHQGRL